MPIKRLFIATSRSSAGVSSQLANDMAALGYAVSFDQALPGGEGWWNRTLDAVEAADAFVFALTRASVDSSACQEQLRYAFELGKPVLPVLLNDEVSDVDMPTTLGAIQRVDYQSFSSAAMAELFSALRGLSATPEVAAIGVTRPECPPEHSLDVASRLASTTHLSRAEQDSILDQLDAYIDAGYGAAELEPVLGGLRDRRLDLAVAVSARLDDAERRLASSTSSPIALPHVDSGLPSVAAEGDPPIRGLFMSYSRSDRVVVDRLVADVRRLGFTIWIDQNLPGGKRWWDQVLLNIRDADVFAFAISPESLASRACLAEFTYAQQLGKPIAGFEIGSNGSVSGGEAVAGVTSVRYVPDDKGSIAGIARLLTGLARTELPVQLPPPPEVPATYTFDVHNQLRSTSELDPEEQAILITQIKRYAAEGVPTGDVNRLVTTFRNRRDVTMRSLSELATVEAELAPRLAGEVPPAHDDAEAHLTPPMTTVADVTPAETDDGIGTATAQELPPPTFEPVASPPPKRRHRGIWFAVAAVAVLAAGGAAWAILGNSDDGGDQPSVDDTSDISIDVSGDVNFVAEPETFQGVSGTTQIQWETDGIVYTAEIQLFGDTGLADVLFFDVVSGTDVWVQEDLSLFVDGDVAFYAGSSPRFMPAGVPADTYSVDTFRLVLQGNGLFTFDQVCDDISGCHQAFPIDF